MIPTAASTNDAMRGTLRPGLPAPYPIMKNYAISLLTGILVGLIYAVFRIPSALPPAVVFIGFLGMFLGEKFAETILRRHAAVPEIQAAAATAVADAAPVPPHH